MTRNAAAYDRDFFAWTLEQAHLLRAGCLSEIDAANLAEEIEAMGRSVRREIRSRLLVLDVHLLKWCHQPALRTPSWRHTIRTQRDEIGETLAESPSLGAFAREHFPSAYRKARLDAADATGLPLKTFAPEPPWSLEQALDPLFPADLGGPEWEEEA